MLTQILSQSRNLVRDAIAPYRFADSLLISYANDAIREIRDKRPDTALNASGTGVTAFTDIPSTGSWTYTITSALYDRILSGLDNITGWDRIAVPTLYFTYTASTKEITVFTDSVRSVQVGHFADCDSTGKKTLTADGSSGYSGFVYVNTVATDADEWQADVAEKALVLAVSFERAMVHFIAHKVFESDWDDAENMNRSAYHYQKFLIELFGEK